jgi:hypothetical protein
VNAGRIALVFIALSVFYYTAASEHARTVNLSKARGDQSGYLWDAQQVYWNWQGRSPGTLVGERNRMPVYAAFLALFYDPKISDDEYFVVGKRWNIRLSLALLGILALIFSRRLPALPAVNLTLVVAFSYFIFKAGYAQSELLFYFLFFILFLAFWSLLEQPSTRGAAWWAAGAGALAAVAHLTKAAVIPFMAVFVAVYAGREAFGSGPVIARLGRTAAVPLALAVVFLAVLSPYLFNSKRTFGHYFYNVNTTFYVWYDDWAAASVGTLLHGDGVGWPTLPPEQIPSAAKYWRTHSLADIAARIGGGFRDMAVRSYATYGYLKYIIWYTALLVLVVASDPADFASAARRHAPLFTFLILYAISHALLIAFYSPISGTGTTRFLIAHLTPFFYTVSRYLARPAVTSRKWIVGSVPIHVHHLHAATAVMLALDIAFGVWPRLMTTYGGF